VFPPRISEPAIGKVSAGSNNPISTKGLLERSSVRDEFDFVRRYRGDVNRHSMAILLKSLLHLGYFPDIFQLVPESVRDFIAVKSPINRMSNTLRA